MNDSGPHFINGKSNGSHHLINAQYWSDSMFRTTLFPAFIYMLILFIIGTLGNSLVCYVYFYKWIKNKTRIFILALAIFDLVNNLVAMPTEMVLLLNFYTFDHPWVCCVSRFITFCMNSASATVLIGIALDRLCGICYWKMLNKFTTKTARYIVCFAVCLALFQSWPALFLYGTQTIPTNQGSELKTCRIADKYIGTLQVEIFQDYVLGSNLLYDIALVVLYSMVGRNLYRNRSFLRKQDRILRKMSQKAGIPTRDRKFYQSVPQDDIRAQNNRRTRDMVKYLDLQVEQPQTDPVKKRSSLTARENNPCDVIEIHLFCQERNSSCKKGSVKFNKEKKKNIQEKKKFGGFKGARESNCSQSGSNEMERQNSIRTPRLRVYSVPDRISSSYKVNSPKTSGNTSGSQDSSPTKNMADLRTAQFGHLQTYMFAPDGRRYRSRSCDGRLNLTTKRIGYVHGTTFRKSRTITMLFIITVVFVISFLPYCIIAIVTHGAKDFYLDSNQSGKISYHLFMRTYFLSSALNPIVYSGFSQAFRRQCKTVFVKVIRVFKFC